MLSIVLLGLIAPTSVHVVSPGLPRMADALGVSPADIGLVVTAITLPPLFLAPVIGILGDLYSRRTIVLASLLLFGSAGVAVAFVNDFATILVLRGLQGLAMAGIAPMSIILIGDLYSGTPASTAQGLRTSATGLSASLTPLVAGALAVIAWNVPFVLYAFAFVGMIGMYRYIPETARGLDADETVVAGLGRYRRSIRAEFDADLFILIAGGFVRFFALFAMITFVPLFAAQFLGATSFEIGAVFATRAVRIFVAPMTGVVVSRISRRGGMIGSLVVLTGSLSFVPFVPNVIWLGGLMVINSVGDAIFGPLLDDTVTGLVDDGNRSGIVSLMRVFKSSGKTIAPVGMGVVLAASSFDHVFFVIAGLLFLYTILVFFALTDVRT